MLSIKLKKISRERPAGEQSEDDLQMMDEDNAAQSTTQVECEEFNGRNALGGSRKKPKNSPKKRNVDGIVQVMERLVQTKEKEANTNQRKRSQQRSCTRLHYQQMHGCI